MVDWAVILGRATQAALHSSRFVVLGPAICSSSIEYGEEGEEQGIAMGGRAGEGWRHGQEGEEQGGAMERGREGEERRHGKQGEEQGGAMGRKGRRGAAGEKQGQRRGGEIGQEKERVA